MLLACSLGNMNSFESISALLNFHVNISFLMATILKCMISEYTITVQLHDIIVQGLEKSVQTDNSNIVRFLPLIK